MNREIYLDPKIFSDPEETERISICQGFDEGLLMAGDNSERVVALCSDPTGSKKMGLFAKEYPERFFNADVTEQSMISVASGMATMGKIPFILSYMTLSSAENLERIKTAMCRDNEPIKIVASYTAKEKISHQTMEDIALMQVIPAMTILTPCDAIEARKATIYAAQIDNPVYIKFPQEKTSIVTTDETPFEIGKAEVFFRPDGDADVGVIAAGPLVYNAICAAKDLDNENIRARVLNLSTINPIDIDAVTKLAQQTGKIVIIEEHQTVGGLGSAVACVLAQVAPVKMRFMGVYDIPRISDGLAVYRGIDIENIKNIIREIYAN